MEYPPPSNDLPKPPFPYIPGWRFPVQSHIPPAPTPVVSRCCENSESSRAERKQLSPLERCLRHPPLEGPESSQAPQSFELRVVHPVRIGDGHKSQVFIVKAFGAHSLPEDKTLVAKLYDPLYLDDEEACVDPFKAVDMFYTHEVRAYELLSEFQDGLVPRFYGSYTTDIPTETTTRTVRLIIIEYVEGISMQQVNSNMFSQDIRKRIMRSVIDSESTVLHRTNIQLRDISPRNVMLLETTSLDPTKHIVFVVFAGALFNRKRDDPRIANRDFFLDQYVSPLLRWKRGSPMEFGDWCDWDWTPWIEKEFAHTADTITQAMREWYDI